MEKGLLDIIRKGVRRNEKLNDLICLADQGNVDAMLQVADCYNKGIYTMENQRNAFLYYKKAANQGSARGELMVGLYFMDGVGVDQDEEQGIYYIQKSANQGFASAQYMMGLYCNAGIVPDKNGELAYQYLLAAAEQGQAGAQVQLGLDFIMEGKKDLDQGLFWLTCAYMHGESAQEDSNKAMDILNELINSGMPGGRSRIDELMDMISENYMEYTINPS